jgi:predicted RNA-binding protein with PUA-like domain
MLYLWFLSSASMRATASAGSSKSTKFSAMRLGVTDLGSTVVPRRTAHWDGCRNYQVRNMMRDVMQRGDLALFYHSNCNPPGVAGIMEITRL